MEEDSSLFMQWAMDTLRHERGPVAAAINDDGSEATTFPSLQALREASHAAEMVQELISAAPATNWSSGDTTDGSSGGNNSAGAPVDHDAWPPTTPNSARRAQARSGSGGTNLPVSWNFGAASPLPGSDGMLAAAEAAAAPTRRLPDTVCNRSPRTRRAGVKGAGSMSAPYAQDHIIAERKRREKINQRFIELSTVIPGLKKMDKATILSDATKYVKELQEKLRDLQEAGGSNGRSIVETVVLVKRPCLHAAAKPDEDGSPLSASSAAPAARKQLPEIEARFSEKSVMVRINCEDGKGVAVKVLTEVEEFRLSITHANVMPFPAGTLIITITAKVEEGFSVTAEEIVGRLKSALLHQHNSSCNSTDEETGN
ncbi:transcription factor bHLH18-like [Panicum miliaceum]|uniref:Transcription factor bHLH18-like n=1 Tax=Panicum miliaceum TaxID=4540 RepID=A0A3L6TLA5_PANMI|nr:transcription factor bHLH18-like [Panicum miliaceum]